MSALAGRTAVVVGAGASAPGWSNGRACAASYARAGAAVVCIDRHLDSAEETLRIIKDEGGTGMAFDANATDEGSMRSVIDQVVAAYGRIDVMHNNVGGSGLIGAPDVIEPEAWDLAIAQSLTSAYLGIRLAVPVMRENGGGVITNTSSILSTRFLRKPNVGYAAAKAGLEAMTRACASAYGRDNIRVNCLRIGFAETPLLRLGLERRGFSPERQDEEIAKSKAKVPLGDHTDPFTIGATAVFLASDEAKDITGVILNIDGGLDCAPI